MLFHVTMDVKMPAAMPEKEAAELKAKEKAIAQGLQERGVWRHLWRVAGRYANVSVFDVKSADELHEILSTLPLFPFMEVEVQALCRHPSSVREGDA